MRRLLGCTVLAAALVACNPAPTYLEAFGEFGDGTPISFRENATLFVGADPQTGKQVALVSSLDPSTPAFTGMVIQVELDTITTPGQYDCSHSGGPAVIRLVVPGTEPLSTTQYTADGSLDILELPTGGNHRFAGSFTGVRLSYGGQDITIDSGSFRGQR